MTLLLFIPYLVLSQSITLQWQDNSFIEAGVDSIDVMVFEGGEYLDGSHLPYYTYHQSLSVDEAENNEYSVSISDVSSSILSDVSLLNEMYVSDDFKVISNVSSSRKKYALEIIIVPFKKDGDLISRLESFQLEITKNPIIKLKSASSWFAEESVLASGNWTKVAVTKDGIYKLSYSKLTDMGVDPSNVSIFTSSPGQLSTMIDDYVDDLKEIPIYDGGDYILFYGQSHNVWNYDSSSDKYIHTQHSFWNENYYFITSDVGDKKRISPRVEPTGTSSQTYTTYIDYDYIEPDEINIFDGDNNGEGSGDDWYSEDLKNGETFTHTFSFDNVAQESASMTMKLAAQSINATHYMKTYVDDELQGSISLSKASTSSTGMAAYETTKTYTFVPDGDNVEAAMTFTCTESTAEGYVDYFAANVICNLQLSGSSLLFRNKPTTDDLVTYQLSDISSTTVIWDVSNPYDVESISFDNTSTTSSFVAEGDLQKQFAAVNTNGSFSTPEVIGTVSNQDLHGLDVPNMVILTDNEFISAANTLADLHRAEGLTVEVTTQEEIANEFSGGKMDITAARWFFKMLYDRSDDFKYVLLFGDGDVNNRMYESGSSIIMAYESDESLNRSSTYVSDDYYGLLDDNEGNGTAIELSDKVDIGIGRIPVNSLSEAEDVVEKIDNYMNNSRLTSWKNTICLVADDQDDNVHVSDANKLAEKVRSESPGIAVKKVFLDAFEQETLASGDRYPDAKSMIDEYINDGVLIWGFTGHGSPTQLTDENIMHLSDIISYENMDNLPLWVTATCDFSPYDHNKDQSSGEEVLLNPIGGGIALFTTTRLVYSSSNYTITNNFYNYILASDPYTNEKHRLGDVARLTKGATGTGANKRKFTLIGDPALQLIYADARWNVETDSINGQDIAEFNDTLEALSMMTVNGHISKSDGSIDTDYNGSIYPTVYDKLSTLSTLANDDDSQVMDFQMWNSVLFTGMTPVTNGRFSFSFMLPKDLDYTAGTGRIEYYATSDIAEVNGYYEDFYIGGFNEDYEVDTVGPVISSYMNSPSFKDGGTVDPSPLYVAEISDASGINTSGNSIGHDITVKLNNDPSTIKIINTSYISNNGDYTQGTLAYQLDDLPEGEHTLVVKLWDMQNNSSTDEITFEVKNDAVPDIAAVYCYPNPVSLSSGESVRFVAEHDRPENTLGVNLSIFDSSGRLMYFTTEYSYTSNNEVYFDWSPSSSPLRSGLYFYRITIEDDDMVSAGKAQKLLISE